MVTLSNKIFLVTTLNVSIIESDYMFDFKNLIKMNISQLYIPLCYDKCKYWEPCQRVVIIDKECYFYNYYDKFNQIECAYDPRCSGSYKLYSNKKIF